ncbi:hypothetical protein N7463_006115 [Penicillium fimorum]|uniref:Uncharacterized protein n=1 Tax=Penicillium fimorum TaxID=1882269 RepID=A0A9X0C6C8_9EURO|nr:hypothetical protein N7463_006115 [Penicillium fimorum]
MRFMYILPLFAAVVYAIPFDEGLVNPRATQVSHTIISERTNLANITDIRAFENPTSGTLSRSCLSPGVRRLGAILFVAPDLDVKLKPMYDSQQIGVFPNTSMRGDLDVETFKDVVRKRWRYQEGNEEMDIENSLSQDNEIENMVWG